MGMNTSLWEKLWLLIEGQQISRCTGQLSVTISSLPDTEKEGFAVKKKSS